MNFANYGGPGLNYLSNSIPESISSSLDEIEGITVVARNRLGDLLEGTKLGQGGSVDAEEVYRTEKLAQVDVLLLGSVSGDPGKVVVAMKAVQVETSRVLAAEVVKSSIAARAMTAAVTGRGGASLSVSSSPSGAAVFIDGIEAGSTPMVGYSVTEGKHEVRVVLDGYMEYREMVTMAADTHERLKPVLLERRMSPRCDIGIGVFYLVPLNKEVRPKILYGPLSFTIDLRALQTGVEVAFALNQQHDMVLTSPLNTPFTMMRNYDLLMFHLFFNVLPFPQRRYRLSYVFPYTGVAVGVIQLWDTRVNQAMEGDKELIISQTNFSLGGKVGLGFLPISDFIIFFEGRFYWQPFRVNRPIYVSQGLGSDMAQVPEWTRIDYCALGGGFKFFF